MAILKSSFPLLLPFLLFDLIPWVLIKQCRAQGLITVSKLQMFVDDLPDMPRIKGYEITDGVAETASLEIGMFPTKWKFHRDVPLTSVFAYGTSAATASLPGPTIEAMYNVPTRVTWLNHLPSQHILPWDPTIVVAKPRTGVPTVVHLHGGIHEPASDGHLKAWFTSGFGETGPTWSTKTYSYSNFQQPGNMWYHDHAMGLTRVNLLAGLLGFYILRNPAIEAPLGLPHGDDFDRPLVILDRSFRIDGSIFEDATGNNPTIHPQWQPEYFGDAMIVNGKAWPRLNVTQTKYRFRIVNACNARFLELSFKNGLTFTVIGSDTAYLNQPVQVTKILLGPSEIVDVIVDFSTSTTTEAILVNNAPYPYPGGSQVNEANGNIMKFVISSVKGPTSGPVPAKLITYPAARIEDSVQTRYVALYEYTTAAGQPTHMYLNGKPFDQSATETPKSGTSELWDVINLTQDNHPIHIHLGLFTVLEQISLVGSVDTLRTCMMQDNDPIRCNLSSYAVGQKLGVPAHEQGWKNVFKMQPSYLTKILVRFSLIHTSSPYPFNAAAEPGYVYHCHMLEHEDNEMMRPLKLVSA